MILFQNYYHLCEKNCWLLLSLTALYINVLEKWKCQNLSHIFTYTYLFKKKKEIKISPYKGLLYYKIFVRKLDYLQLQFHLPHKRTTQFHEPINSQFFFNKTNTFLDILHWSKRIYRANRKAFFFFFFF